MHNKTAINVHIIAYKNPYMQAILSAKNAFWLVIDFMYGTPERTKVTFLFAIALALLGGLMFNDAQQQVCTY